MLDRISFERLLIIEFENACGDSAKTLMFVAPRVKLLPFPDSLGAKLAWELAGAFFFLLLCSFFAIRGDESRFYFFVSLLILDYWSPCRFTFKPFFKFFLPGDFFFFGVPPTDGWVLVLDNTFWLLVWFLPVFFEILLDVYRFSNLPFTFLWDISSLSVG